jgi:hypothetical protein
MDKDKDVGQQLPRQMQAASGITQELLLSSTLLHRSSVLLRIHSTWAIAGVLPRGQPQLERDKVPRNLQGTVLPAIVIQRPRGGASFGVSADLRSVVSHLKATMTELARPQQPPLEAPVERGVFF